MISKILLLLTLLLVALLGSQEVDAQTCTGCDTCCYYVLTYSQVQATCRMEDKSQGASNTKECKPQAELPTKITIHGLWPQLTDSTAQLGYCKDSTEVFNATRLAPIRSELVATWPTAFTGTGQSDESFWQHEWDKHGTCSRFNMLTYFSTALAIDTLYPINDWLTAANIVPSNSRVYSVSQVQAAFVIWGGISTDTFVLKCVSVKGGIQILKDVMLCVSQLDNKTLVNCSSVKNTCKGLFYLLEDFTQPLA